MNLGFFLVAVILLAMLVPQITLRQTNLPLVVYTNGTEVQDIRLGFH